MGRRKRRTAWYPPTSGSPPILRTLATSYRHTSSITPSPLGAPHIRAIHCALGLVSFRRRYNPSNILSLLSSLLFHLSSVTLRVRFVIPSHLFLFRSLIFRCFVRPLGLYSTRSWSRRSFVVLWVEASLAYPSA